MQVSFGYRLNLENHFRIDNDQGENSSALTIDMRWKYMVAVDTIIYLGFFETHTYPLSIFKILLWAYH